MTVRTNCPRHRNVRGRRSLRFAPARAGRFGRDDVYLMSAAEPAAVIFLIAFQSHSMPSPGAPFA